nr:retrovirus-related Pol polyprotein from transposon TNT 1-94 [Tanacetum cinerariifolium]
MTRDRSQLTNFIDKFLGTVKFSNDHVEKIIGYGDYQIGNVMISRVYFVDGLGHNLFSVRKFCDPDLEVAFRQHTCFIRNLKDNGTEFVNQTLREYYEQVGISHERSVARSPQQNSVVERQAVATVCFTQNRSIVRLRHGKSPYDLLHVKLLDLSFFHVFGALCYPTNDSENLGKFQPKADIGPTLPEMTPATISSGLVTNPTSLTSFVPLSRTDWDMLFRPLFDELITPLPSVDHPAPRVIAPIAKVVALELVASTGSPSSTTVDQDAPSPSNSQTTPKLQSSIIPNGVEDDNHDLDVTHMNNDPFFGILIPEVFSDQSSSMDSIHIIV